MASGVDLWMYLNTSCVECSDLVPPPDSILGIPPPPLPAFLQRAPNMNTSTCSVLCDWNAGPGVEYVELPRQGPAMDDTWLLVLIASCVGVLLLGALLALFLLKCRVERSGKGSLQLDGSTLSKAKGVKGCEAVLYPCPSSGGALTPDSRVLWAALTPRGTTQHFTTEPHYIPQYGSTQSRSLPPIPTPPVIPEVSPYQVTQLPVSFDNSGFVDTDDPTPVVESYQLSDMMETSSNTATIGSTCSMRTCGSPRPRVSSPTRIEHPNLPPLNLHPSHRSLRRATLSRRESDASSVSSAIVL
ncbi:hypothetical protein L9F63_003159 [Diploptera punctata]|uniref:Uncharacterized protein n=1 Tax=Diploptera punctata TaxID=6984 RepID=A0AAD7ZLB9_DIPPU|nr:hypothetical protein L9F63_003159 [Diploptera punctata]